MSHERHSLLTSYGAEVVFSAGEGGMMGSVVKAEAILAEHPDYFMPHQFNNPANPEIHRRTTAREIVRDMGVQAVDAFVAGVGTGGTITGVGEVLKAKRPATRVVAVEPAGCAVLSGGQAGPQAGAAVCAAVRVARGMSPDENVVVVLPDGAERYFSLEQQFR
jgi:cysteine synthase A